MPTTIRKQLLSKADQALNCVDRMDELLFVMDKLQAGRQPAITDMKAHLIEGQEMLRTLWRILKEQL